MFDLPFDTVDGAAFECDDCEDDRSTVDMSIERRSQSDLTSIDLPCRSVPVRCLRNQPQVNHRFTEHKLERQHFTI
jgi:hypothetical protein